MSSTTSWSGVGLSPPGASSPLKYAFSRSTSASPPAISGDMLRRRARVTAISARPLRAAVPRRFMFNDEGGVGTTSSVCRDRRAARRGLGAALRAGFRADFRADLADFLRLGRLAERFGAAFFRFRLAIISPSFRNLDSFRVSVVLSNAYRYSNLSRGGRARVNNPGNLIDRRRA